MRWRTTTDLVANNTATTQREQNKQAIMTKKNFVLDTNVLLTDPAALSKFGDHNIVLPITVIEELDKFKRDLSDLGRNAREVTRTLDRFRTTKGHSLSKGVPTTGGGLLRVWTDLGKEPPLPFPTLGKTADSLILASALLLKKREDLPVVFVSRDINLRLRADAVGLTAQNYEEGGETRSIEELYSGLVQVELEEEVFQRYYKNNNEEQTLEVPKNTTPTIHANQCVLFKSKENPNQTILGRYREKTAVVRPILDRRQGIMGIRERNVEQQFAMDLLLDDQVQIVTLAGKAGTGKTLLAIAAGLQKVVQEHQYSKLVVARPIMPLGKELGFLPGEIGEKLRPWMEPVFDNLEFILKMHHNIIDDDEEDGGHRRKSLASEDILQQNLEHILNKHRHHPKGRVATSDDETEQQPKQQRRRQRKKYSVDADIRAMLDSGVLEVQPLTYVRGRSLPGQFFIIDEAQNLTHHEVKTIVTRAGEGTKVVLTGDPYQIDNPFLDSVSCGLAIVVEKLKGQLLAGHITLTRGERSELAEMASDLL